MIELVPIEQLRPDDTNPRTADSARLHLLTLSLSKLGFILPVCATPEGLVLSGHQRLTVASNLGMTHIPVQFITLPQKSVKGINIQFNRVTNDFGALDTGSSAAKSLNLSSIVEDADNLPDRVDQESWPVLGCKEKSIAKLGKNLSDRYDKKAVVAALSLQRKGIRIPVVISESGIVVNGVHRLLAAKESAEATWPIVEIPDELADFALHFLNYLSMDYSVDEEFADLLRFSAYRRPQNNRGSVPKAYRFWANGERTLSDKDSYTVNYWRTFRDLHGNSVLDFGAGLCNAAPFLRTKGIDCTDFEPYRIDRSTESGKPDAEYSIAKAKEFLDKVESGDVFDSIFLASVLNSIPFYRDRMCVLTIVSALCSLKSVVYGTCRDISDFNYEYGGIRQASYFVFDSEPGVRLGDVLNNPKLQKFHTKDEAAGMFNKLWAKVDTWPGGNVFYWRASAPRRVNPAVLGKALEFEFDLPYSSGKRMGLADYAKAAFGKRLGIVIP